MQLMNDPFEALYQRLLHTAKHQPIADAVRELPDGSYNIDHLDCLLHPRKHPVVWRIKDRCCASDSPACVESCEFDAMKLSSEGPEIDTEKCVGCGRCIECCKQSNLIASKDAIAVLGAGEQEAKPIGLCHDCPGLCGAVPGGGHPRQAARLPKAPGL